MSVRFLTISHSPIIMIRARPPQEEPVLLEHLRIAQESIKAFDPELIILLGTDHFAGFHLSQMPPFCIGINECTAVDDVGGYAGNYKVDKESALGLVQHLRDEGFDPTISFKMRVDHAFSQPIHRLFGELDVYPVVPIFISVLTPPFMAFKRSRLFGEAIGHYAKQSGKRILIIGTGGLSHHPTRYYPSPDQADPDVFAYQMDGDRGGGKYDDESWFKRLYEMHVEGADMLISGARTREDIKLNPEMDQWFLKQLEDGTLEALDDMANMETVEKAGIGFMELHTWIAARAAHMASGSTAKPVTTYSPALEYGIGYGMAYTTE